jgi:predicted regulator of Ras-like GTPase activity (Roadblock/LC7/MglB family)
MSAVLERTDQRTTSVDVVLRTLLAYDEVVGAVAVNTDGLVMGSAGMTETDVDVVSLLGASLTGVAERTTRRLGTGPAIGLSLITTDGMITIGNGGNFAVMVFSARCDSVALLEALAEPLERIRAIIDPA